MANDSYFRSDDDDDDDDEDDDNDDKKDKAHIFSQSSRYKWASWKHTALYIAWQIIKKID